MSGVGLNLRVSYKLCQGGRKYMEDVYSVHFVESADGDTELAFIGVFDGHGGREAAEFAKKHLVQEIINQDTFWSDDDDQVLEAIKIGFVRTHELMWKEVDNWSKTGSGKRSTAGTTSSIGIIRNSKLYVGHVGDSAIVLGNQLVHKHPFEAVQLTTDHKPECPEEKKRIEDMGGKVVEGKTGVQRVVWNRPVASHKGPVRRSTQLEQIPFLAVARSLGDLWSYNSNNGEFAVSPVPDVAVYKLDPNIHKCLIFGSDGLWNMLQPQEAVLIVQNVEEKIEDKILNDPTVGINYWINPSARIVDRAIQRWQALKLRADNTTAVVVLLDPYGPRKSERLLAQRKINMKLLREKEKSCLQDDSEVDGAQLSPKNIHPKYNSPCKLQTPPITLPDTYKIKASEQPGVSCTVKSGIPSSHKKSHADENSNNNSAALATSKPATLTRQTCIHPKLSPSSSSELLTNAINTENSIVDCGRSLRASNGSKSNRLSLNSKVIHNLIKAVDIGPASKTNHTRSQTTDESSENDDQVANVESRLRRRSARLTPKRGRSLRANIRKNIADSRSIISKMPKEGHMRLRPRSTEKNQDQNTSPPQTRSNNQNKIFTALKRKNTDNIDRNDQRCKRARVV